MSNQRDTGGRFLQKRATDGMHKNRYSVPVPGSPENWLNVSLRSCDLLHCPDAGKQVVCVEINSGFAHGASLCLACVEKLAGLLRAHREEVLALGERYDVENPPVATRYGGGLAMPRHGKMRL